MWSCAESGSLAGEKGCHCLASVAHAAALAVVGAEALEPPIRTVAARPTHGVTRAITSDEAPRHTKHRDGRYGYSAVVIAVCDPTPTKDRVSRSSPSDRQHSQQTRHAAREEHPHARSQWAVSEEVACPRPGNPSRSPVIWAWWEVRSRRPTRRAREHLRVSTQPLPWRAVPHRLTPAWRQCRVGRRKWSRVHSTAAPLFSTRSVGHQRLR